jgi:hypothetical protein
VWSGRYLHSAASQKIYLRALKSPFIRKLTGNNEDMLELLVTSDCGLIFFVEKW